MKRSLFITMLCLMGNTLACVSNSCPARAHNAEVCGMTAEGEDLAFDVKKKPRPSNNDVNMPHAPICIPKIALENHTLHFITPCTGLTLQLVQDDEVCYETVITSDYLEIPSSITGVYELQILRGDYVFFAEIEL